MTMIETPAFWVPWKKQADTVKDESIYGAVYFSYFCVGFWFISNEWHKSHIWELIEFLHLPTDP